MIRLTWDKAYLLIPLVLFTWVITSAHLSISPSLFPAAAQSPLEILTQCESANANDINRLISQLQKFPLEAYDAKSRQKVEGLVVNSEFHTAKYIKLAGFLGRCDFVQSLRESYEKGSPEKLAVNLALVRCGDQGRINSFIRNLRKAEFGDAMMYEVVPMMIYTRQQEVYELLVEFAHRDSKRCTSEGETGRPVICGYRIIEQLAPVLENYPYEQLASGDLNTTDYPGALAEIRSWLTAFGKQLPIIQNTY